MLEHVLVRKARLTHPRMLSRGRFSVVAREMRKNWPLYAMLVLPLAGFFLFRYLPLFGEITAFQDYDIIDGFWNSRWVGFDNFLNFFKDRYFIRLVSNTILLGLYSLLWGFPTPILFALMLDQVRQQHGLFKRISQTLSYLPHFIPIVVVVGMMWDFFAFDGIVNIALSMIGTKGPNFLSEASWFRPLYVGSGVWQDLGWGSIIYLAAITSTDPNLYEAAAIDGANRLQQIVYVTLPGMVPTIRTLFILRVASIVSINFEKVYLMQQPGTYETSDVIATYVYRRGITGLDFSYGTAVGLVNSIVSVLLLLLAHYVLKKVSGEGLW